MDQEGREEEWRKGEKKDRYELIKEGFERIQLKPHEKKERRSHRYRVKGSYDNSRRWYPREKSPTPPYKRKVPTHDRGAPKKIGGSLQA